MTRKQQMMQQRWQLVSDRGLVLSRDRAFLPLPEHPVDLFPTTTSISDREIDPLTNARATSSFKSSMSTPKREWMEG
eukprot:173906-Rhodomonas_salina.2